LKLNRNTGIVKTYLAEVTDETNKPKAFVLNGLAASFGRISKLQEHSSLIYY
jgi:hypothetical protein